MFKHKLRPIALTGCILALLFTLSTVRHHYQAGELKQPGTHPDYFKQWFEMKKNDQGEIPSGLHQKWFQHDKKVLSQITDRSPHFGSVEYLGPPDVGGRTRALLIDDGSQGRILAGGISGGMWRSTNYGSSWTALNDQEVSLMVSCVTQSPFSSSVMYYGTGETRANSAGVPGDGVFKSTNSGASWTQLASTVGLSQFEKCWAIQHSRSDANTVFVGTENNGCYRSTDAGTSWTQVYTTGDVVDILTFDDGSVILAVSGSGLWRSTTGNAGTFTQISSGAFPATFQRIEIDHCDGDQDYVYAAFESTNYYGGCNGFCQSTDGGLTWTARTTPSAGNIYGRYCFMLGVHPSDPDYAVVAGVTMKLSSDGGTSWGSVSSSHADYHSFDHYDTDVDSFLVGNDGGVYRYSWSAPTGGSVDLNDGYHVTQFYAGDFGPTGSVTLSGTQDNGTYRVQASGTDKMIGGDGAFAHVSLQNADVAYGESQNGNMRRSTNFTAGSPSWSNINTNATMDAEGYAFVNANQINYADGDQLYVRTNSGFWRTTDRGSNWTKLTTGSISSIYGIGVEADTDPIVYFGGSAAKFYRIDDAVSSPSVTDLSASVPASVTSNFISSISVHPDNNATCYVGFSQFNSNPRAWKVTNATSGSPTWTDISGDLPSELPVNYIQPDPEDPDNSLYAATDFGLYYTTNGGTNWIKETDIPNVSIHEAKLRASDRTLFLFTHGRGIWELALPEVTCSVSIFGYPYYESFETGFGLWSQDSGDDFDWTRKTGPTSSKGTGPNLAADGSYYLYTEASGNSNSAANLLSPCVFIAGLSDPVMSFQYHMKGSTMGTLELQYIADGSPWTTLWSATGDQGPDWEKVYVDLSSLPSTSVQFRFRGTTGTSFTSDISIDDIEIKEDPCIRSFPYAESFESGTGGWTQETGDNFDWTRDSGGTTSANTGPSTGSDGSWYMYTESSSPNFPSKTARFRSPCFDFGGVDFPSISFDYHMYGAAMGELRLDASVGGTLWTNIWKHDDGDNGNTWKTTTVSLASFGGQDNVYLRFYGITGSSFTSDMAVDNIVVDEGCVATLPYLEDFEGLREGWSHDPSDDFDWLPNSGTTPSGSTGPTAAYSGSYYMYVESSTPNNPNKSGNYMTPCFDFSQVSVPVITYRYHMYGATMGSLQVQASSDGGSTWSTLFTHSGDQGNVWNVRTISMTGFAGEEKVQIRFRGTTSTGITSDMAIDYVQVYNGSICRQDYPVSQGFESAFSPWNQDTGDDTDWTRQTGGTSSLNTGPSAASVGSYYAYIESSAPNYPSKTANLLSNCLDLYGHPSAFVTFDYHMYGAAMGSLYLEATTNGGSTWSTLWSQSGDQGNTWTNQVVDLSSYSGETSLQLRFRGVTGTSFTSDMAVDNISVIVGDIPPPPAENTVLSPEEETVPQAFAPEDYEALVKAWPNPFGANVYLQIPEQLGENFQVTVLNASGQIVLRRSYQPNGRELILDSQNWTAGLYLIQIQGDAYKRTFKMIRME